MTTTKFDLTRNAYGRLALTDTDGLLHEGVMPVRAFPVQAPQEGYSMVTTDGKEVAWIDRLDDLAADVRALVEEELGGREFMPEISRIVGVTSSPRRARGRWPPIAATPSSCCAARRISAASAATRCWCRTSTASTS